MNPENEIDKTEALEPVETAAANVAEARGGVDGRKRPKWLLPLIAVVCAVVLVVAGVVGWNMYRGAKLAEAKEACATAADGVRSQANEYNALLNGDAADAAAVKAEQVKDAKTVESLGKELKASAPEYEGCVAEDAKGLDAATVKLGEQADWYKTHEQSLSKAVKAVTESKAAKTLETAKTNLTAKLDEAAKLLTDSDGKVQDNTTRETLTNAIDAATRLKDANDATKIDKARKTLEDAINGVNASVQAKTDADAQAAAAARPLRLRRKPNPPTAAARRTPATRTGAQAAPHPAPTPTVAPHRADRFELPVPVRPVAPPQDQTSTAHTAVLRTAMFRRTILFSTD